MSTSLMSRISGLLLALALLPAAAAMSQSSDPPGESQGYQLQDRILAVVDEDPILLSDVERLLRLGLTTAGEGEDDEAVRQRALEALIEQRLRLHEVERFGFQEIPVRAVEGEVEALRARFSGPEELAGVLDEVGLTEEGLRQLLVRQRMVLVYVEERLGPRVFIDPQEIDAYYRDTLVPQLARGGGSAPPVDEVREQIRRVLRERRLNEEIASWTAELRQQASIEVFPEGSGELPPVREVLDEGMTAQ